MIYIVTDNNTNEMYSHSCVDFNLTQVTSQIVHIHNRPMCFAR